MIFERLDIFGITLFFAERTQNFDMRRVGTFAQSIDEPKVENFVA